MPKDEEKKDSYVVTVEIIGLGFVLIVTVAILCFLYGLWKNWQREYVRQNRYYRDFIESREQHMQQLELQQSFQRSSNNLINPDFS